MSCSVAIAASSPAASSPAASFSTSHHRIPLSCKTSPETLMLTLIDVSPSSTSPAKSPFRSSRFNRGPTALFKSSSPPPSPPSNCTAANNSGPSSPRAMKRKRPARIDVPMMTDVLSLVPIASDGRKEVEVNGVTCSVYCRRGKKRFAMEDRFKVDLDIGGDPKLAFFGIFDGHSGSEAAEFVSENLGKSIMDAVMREDGNVEEAVANGYLKTDSDFLKEETTNGTCCVTAFVRKGNLVVSNAGDCRAVLSISGYAEPLTSDHRPSREDERERIENLGGYVHFCRGLWRLQGSLAVSRGIGDSHLKQWVIPDPETRVLEMKPEFEFLILASDGLWDKVGNQEAVDLARPLCVEPQNPSPLSACKMLADLAANQGSVDDISVMIIQLKHFF